MLKHSLAAGLLACAALTPAAFAQDAKPAQNQSAQADSIKFVKDIEAEQFRSSNLVGQTVYNRQDENIGDISDLILDRSGQVAGVVIGVGGFLGIGKSEVAVPMNALKFERDDNAMAANDGGAAGPATGRAAADVEKEPGSAGQPSGTSTEAALPNQNQPDRGNAQQNAAENAGQAKQDPAKTGAASSGSNADAANQAGASQNQMAANESASGADNSAEENWLDGMKIVLNTTRDDLGNAPKLGESEADRQQRTNK